MKATLKPTILAALIASLLPFSAPALDYADVAASIRDYQYGDSRIPLAWIEDLVHWSQSFPQEREQLADTLAELVAGDATFDCKQFACRQLAVIGGAEHVPALAALLQSTAFADIARYALERIPAPEADAALIEILGVTEGDTRVGLINSLGARGSLAALQIFGDIVEEDGAAAKAAIAALGRITDRQALRILARAKVAPAHVAAVAHARLAQADALSNADDARTAKRIYEDLLEDPASTTIERAALMGLLRLGDEDEQTELLNTTNDDEWIQEYIKARRH